jgi:hypothetical protein
LIKTSNKAGLAATNVKKEERGWTGTTTAYRTELKSEEGGQSRTGKKKR